MAPNFCPTKSEFGIQNPVLVHNIKIWHTNKYSYWCTKSCFRVPNLDFRVTNLHFRVPNLYFGIPNLSFRTSKLDLVYQILISCTKIRFGVRKLKFGTRKFRFGTPIKSFIGVPNLDLQSC